MCGWCQDIHYKNLENEGLVGVVEVKSAISHMGSVSESSVRSRAKGCGAEELTGLKGSREDEVVVYEKKLSR